MSKTVRVLVIEYPKALELLAIGKARELLVIEYQSFKLKDNCELSNDTKVSRVYEFLAVQHQNFHWK